MADFFGLGEECPRDQMKWRNRSIKLHDHSVLGGKVAPDTIAPADTYESVFESVSQASSRPATSTRRIVDPLARGHVARSELIWTNLLIYMSVSNLVLQLTCLLAKKLCDS